MGHSSYVNSWWGKLNLTIRHYQPRPFLYILKKLQYPQHYMSSYFIVVVYPTTISGSKVYPCEYLGRRELFVRYSMGSESNSTKRNTMVSTQSERPSNMLFRKGKKTSNKGRSRKTNLRFIVNSPCSSSSCPLRRRCWSDPSGLGCSSSSCSALRSLWWPC